MVHRYRFCIRTATGRQPDEFRTAIPRLQTAGQPNGNRTGTDGYGAATLRARTATVRRPYGYGQQPSGNRAGMAGNRAGTAGKRAAAGNRAVACNHRATGWIQHRIPSIKVRLRPVPAA
ncbi:hypothetical protein HDU67_003651, partial [Dinochytrium kinnereticum]